MGSLVGFLHSAEIIIFVLLSVAFFSLFERKLMGMIQNRKGPSKVGMGGMFQPFSDAMKLVSKNEFFPMSVVKLMYLISPSISFFISLIFWLEYPLKWNFSSWQMSVVFLLSVFSVSVYGLIMTSWFSSSKFAVIGCVRALAQSISYEVGLTLGLISISLTVSTVSLEEILELQNNVPFFFSFFFFFFFFLFIFFAETNRSPFDLAEGESELVSGFCVEYGGVSYTLIFLAENLSIVFVSVLMGVYYFVGSLFAVGMVLILFVLLRSSLPRFRFDVVMGLFWLVMLPLQIFLSCLYLVLMC